MADARRAEDLLLEGRDPAAAWDALRAAWEASPRAAGDYGEGRETADADAERREKALIAALDGVLSRDPRFAGAWLWRGALKRKGLDYAGAAEDLDRAWSLGLRTAAALTWRGEARLQRLDRARGLADMKAATRRRDALAWNHAWCGRAMLNHFRDRAGLAYLDRAIALDPSWAEARAWRGEARRRVGDAKGAIADFDAALSLGPDAPLRLLVRGLRGLLLVDLGRADEAARELEAVSEAAPGRALWVFGRATASRALGRLGDWVDLLDRAAALDSKYEKNLGVAGAEDREALLRDLSAPAARARPAAARLRGRLLLACGRAAEAEAELALHCRRAPKDADARLRLVEALAGQGKLAEAKAALGAAKKLARGASAAEASLLGARLALAEDDSARAEALYREALAVDERCGPALAELGALRLAAGEDDARDLLERAVAVSHGDVRPLVDLSAARREDGDESGAKEAWARALSLDDARARERAAAWESLRAGAPRPPSRSPRRVRARRRARP